MINQQRLSEALEVEEKLFISRHPKSKAAANSASSSLIAGVPMPWMTRWPGSFPLYVRRASGARFTDIDDIEYVDFCLGDTGAMTGHAVAEITQAISTQLSNGSTMMLPTQDASWVGEELTRRFGLPKWQFTISATDANRFVLRIARSLNGATRVVRAGSTCGPIAPGREIVWPFTSAITKVSSTVQ